MSQRADTLNTIRNDAEVRGLLLRPLNARLLPPTPMEESGLVDREKLYAINGPGRAPGATPAPRRRGPPCLP